MLQKENEETKDRPEKNTNNKKNKKREKTLTLDSSRALETLIELRKKVETRGTM